MHTKLLLFLQFSSHLSDSLLVNTLCAYLGARHGGSSMSKVLELQSTLVVFEILNLYNIDDVGFVRRRNMQIFIFSSLIYVYKILTSDF